MELVLYPPVFVIELDYFDEYGEPLEITGRLTALQPHLGAECACLALLAHVSYPQSIFSPVICWP